MNGKVRVAGDAWGDRSYITVFRCNLDGTSCTGTNLPPGDVAPILLVDSANQKLLVVTIDKTNGSRPALFRCALDMTGCVHVDISAGQGPGSGGGEFAHAAVLDTVHGKLLVVTDNGANDHALFRCNLDGSSCSYLDLSAGQGPNSGTDPTAVIDRANQKLIVATNLGLFFVPLW